MRACRNIQFAITQTVYVSLVDLLLSSPSSIFCLLVSWWIFVVVVAVDGSFAFSSLDK